MKALAPVAFPVLAVSLLVLAACSEQKVAPPGGSKLAQSEACFNNSCHQNATSPGTGNNIAQEWLLSGHNTKNGAACADCHEPVAGHPTGGTAAEVTVNPDSAGKCAKCHTLTKGFGISTYDGIAVDTAFVHFSSGSRSSYVSRFYQKSCRRCHNPHDTASAMDILRQWSRSNVGSTTTAARTSHSDLKTRGSSIPAADNFGNACVRCHSTTGFLNYASSGFSDVQALPDTDGTRSNYPAYPSGSSSYNDKSRESDNCDGCHTDGRSDDPSAYSYRLRPVAQVTAYFNYSSAPLHQRAWDVKYKTQYPAFGTSNACIICHTGREIGLVIKLASVKGIDFSNQQRIDAHNQSSASTMNAVGGFHFYSSAARYANPDYRHNTIGLAASGYSGGSHGPCIGCHMENNRSHAFMPVKITAGTISEVLSDQQTCSQCHTTQNSAHPARTPALLEARKRGMAAALKTLQQMLLHPRQNAAYSVGVPSSAAAGGIGYTVAGKPIINQWTAAFGNGIVPGSGNPLKSSGADAVTAGAYTMGAAFNYETISKQTGAYAHNSRYVRRLIYDSLDWLYDGAVNQNAKTALDWLKSNSLITSGTAASTYEMALEYLFEGDVTYSRP